MLKDKDGKPIDLSGLDEKTASVLTAFASAIPGMIGGAINASVKPIEAKLDESLSAINTRLETVPPKEEPGGDGGGKPPEGGTGDSAALRAILDEIKGLKAKQEELESSTAKERAAKAARERTEAYINTNLPNLKGKAAIIDRIAAKQPGDDEAVRAAVEAERTYYEQVAGSEAAVKLFSADPSDEGGKAGNTDEDAEVASKIEALEKQLQATG